MTEPPPQRYRVVERGRRLEVIDTWNGDRPVSRPPPAPPESRGAPARLRLSPGKAETRQRLSGGRTLRTAAWWDGRGPRTLYLSREGEDALRRAIGYAGALIAILFVVGIILLPVGIVLVALAASKPARTWLRGRIADWLDVLDQAEADIGAREPAPKTG